MDQNRQSVAIGIGANLGDPGAAIATAIAALGHAGLEELRCASLYRTHPIGCAPGTPDFLNTAVTGRWRGSLLALLTLCRRIECSLGRPAYRPTNAARAIDLDLLLAGERQIDCAFLTLPHPRLTQRRFALEPLAEIAPRWVVPPQGMTVVGWRDRARREPGAAGWGERLRA